METTPEYTTNGKANNDAPAWMNEFAVKVESFLDGDPKADQVKTPNNEGTAEEAVMDLVEATGYITEQLMTTRKALLNATLERNDAKARYEDAKRDAYLIGAVTGKNEAERDARLASVCEVQIANLRRADAALLKAQTDFDCTMDLANANRLMFDLQSLAG